MFSTFELTSVTIRCCHTCKGGGGGGGGVVEHCPVSEVNNMTAPLVISDF